MPSITAAPNDQIDYDINGLPVITRTTQSKTNTITRFDPVVSMSLHLPARFNPTDPALAQAVADYHANASTLWSDFWGSHPRNGRARKSRIRPVEAQYLGVTIGNQNPVTTTSRSAAQIPVGQIMLEYQKAALARSSCSHRTQCPARRLQQRHQRVERSRSGVLKEVSGKDLGQDPESWKSCGSAPWRGWRSTARPRRRPWSGSSSRTLLLDYLLAGPRDRGVGVPYRCLAGPS